jgi:hypothetical protein
MCVVAVALFFHKFNFDGTGMNSASTITTKASPASSKVDPVCCTFKGWRPWEFCPVSGDEEQTNQPVYQSPEERINEKTNSSFLWRKECIVRKSWSFAEPEFDDSASCSVRPLFDNFVENKRVPLSLRGSRILLLGDSTFRMMFHDICSLLLPEEYRRAPNSPLVKGYAWDFKTPTQWANWTSGKINFENLATQASIACSVPQDNFALAWSMIFSADDDPPGDIGLAVYQAGGLEKINTTWRIKQAHEDLQALPSWGGEKQPALVVFGSCYWDLTKVNGAVTNEQVQKYGAAVEDRGAQLRQLFPKARILFHTCYKGTRKGIDGMSLANEHHFSTIARQIVTSTASEWDGLVDPWTLLQKQNKDLSFDGFHYPPTVSLAILNIALNQIDICEQSQTMTSENKPA